MINALKLGAVLAKDWTIVLLVIYALVTIIPIYLFFCADTSDSGINGSVSRTLTIKLPNMLRRAVRSCFGQNTIDRLESVYDYVFNQRNPIMQILYMVLINSAFIAWMMTGMQQLPTYLVKYDQAYISVAFVLVAQYTYYLACSVGPGTITKENVQCFSHQPYDGLLYLPGSQCSSCQIPKVRLFCCVLCSCVAVVSTCGATDIPSLYNYGTPCTTAPDCYLRYSTVSTAR
jgi:hypothetical protein